MNTPESLIVTDMATAMEKIQWLQTQLQQSLSDCAVMREALGAVKAACFYEGLLHTTTARCMIAINAEMILNKALSTNSGKALLDEVEALRSDAQRLNFLFENNADVRWDDDGTWHVACGAKVLGEGHSPREAVDSAITLQKKGSV